MLNKKLIVIAILLFLLSFALKYGADFMQSGVLAQDAKSKEFASLQANWGNKNASLQKLNVLTDDFGKKYFSATLNQKRADSTSFMIAFLVLNADELDAILKRVIDDTLIIKKLEIINNEIGYLVTLEVAL